MLKKECLPQRKKLVMEMIERKEYFDEDFSKIYQLELKNIN